MRGSCGHAFLGKVFIFPNLVPRFETGSFASFPLEERHRFISGPHYTDRCLGRDQLSLGVICQILHFRRFPSCLFLLRPLHLHPQKLKANNQQELAKTRKEKPTLVLFTSLGSVSTKILVSGVYFHRPINALQRCFKNTVFRTFQVLSGSVVRVPSPIPCHQWDLMPF